MAKKRKLEASPSADRSELLPLLEAAKADHWDDGPRLALADWLEENGGEADRGRADVIRLQLDTSSGGPDWSLTVERLRDRWVEEWVASHLDFFSRKRPDCERGLLAAGVSVSPWMRGEGDASWAWVETARIQSIDARDVPGLLASPRMATVPRLEFTGNPLGVVALREASGSLIRGGLRSLSVSTAAHNVAELAKALRPGLEELSVTAVGIGPRAWGDLFASPGVEGLRGLHLDISHLTDADAASLAAAPGLRGLSRLALYRTDLTADGLAALAALPLRRLVVMGSCGPAAASRLAGSPCAEAIEDLRLLLGGDGPPPRLPRLPRLRRLAIRSNHGMVGLDDLPGALEELVMSGNTLGPAGAAAFTGAGKPGPRSLRVSTCDLGDAGVASLASWPGLGRVRFLDLALNGLGDDAVRALIASPHAGSLEALCLDHNPKITVPALEALLRSPLGARLRWLSLVNLPLPPLRECAPAGLREVLLGGANLDAIGKKGLSRLRAALPDCAIG